MSAAGELDLERPGVNSRVTKEYFYTGDDLTSIEATHTHTLNGVEVVEVYTKTFSYSAGILVSASDWVKTTS